MTTDNATPHAADEYEREVKKTIPFHAQMLDPQGRRTERDVGGDKCFQWPFEPPWLRRPC